MTVPTSLSFFRQRKNDLSTPFDSFEADLLNQSVSKAAAYLISLQKADGHWAFELEADATIPSEYILLQHYLNEINAPQISQIADYLRSIQADHGGWPLFHGGDFDISASVKAYFALKAAGDKSTDKHMLRARIAILSHGGAAKANVFTRIQLALFREVPWRAVPVMPVEIMNLPRWFPFHLSKISYWSRTVIVPLLVLMAKKPQAINPHKIHIQELFVIPPEQVTNWHSNTNTNNWSHFFRACDAVLQKVERFFPRKLRTSSIQKAVAWVTERLNGEDGLGAIYPAMANAVMMFECLGYAKDHPDLVIAKKALDKLMISDGKRTYCQPCLSPIWDTGLAALALLEAGGSAAAAARGGAAWLASKQILTVRGDWADTRPDVKPGGWAFQYANDYYPDLDDTAVVLIALDRADQKRHKQAVKRGVDWVLGLQCKDGGWGAFDADNTHYYLNNIPFADHGALLDPPTADVTARCIGMLAQLGYKADHPQVKRALDWLRRNQEDEGCWFGRWGTNYIYGTWSVLNALNAIGIDRDDAMIRKAANWLLLKQRKDGGWGEDGRSYWAHQPKGEGAESLPSQTAWALLGLMAAGETDRMEVARGVDYLLETQNLLGSWDETYYNAVGFPRVFYITYHGYKSFFPLWALARYRNLKNGTVSPIIPGM